MLCFFTAAATRPYKDAVVPKRVAQAERQMFESEEDLTGPTCTASEQVVTGGKMNP